MTDWINKAIVSRHQQQPPTYVQNTQNVKYEHVSLREAHVAHHAAPVRTEAPPCASIPFRSLRPKIVQVVHLPNAPPVRKQHIVLDVDDAVMRASPELHASSPRFSVPKLQPLVVTNEKLESTDVPKLQPLVVTNEKLESTDVPVFTLNALEDDMPMLDQKSEPSIVLLNADVEMNELE
jgi:hypothetical protein